MLKSYVLKISLFVLLLAMLLVGSVPAGTLVGDLNSSGEVNIEDLVILAGQWLDDSGCVGHPDDCADLIGNDGVNLADLGIMSENWLKQLAIPPAPSLSLPADGSIVAGTSIDFSWLALAGADDYYLQVATDSGFSSLVYNAAVGDNTSINLGSYPDDGTRFFWHVRAGNVSGWSGYSAARYFDNGIPLIPHSPSLTLPVDESNVAGTNIDFSWLASAGANKYHLQVAEDSSFSSLIYDGSVGDVTNYKVWGFPSDGSGFYWRVRAENYPGDIINEKVISEESTQWHYRKGQSEPP